MTFRTARQDHNNIMVALESARISREVVGELPAGGLGQGISRDVVGELPEGGLGQGISREVVGELSAGGLGQGISRPLT